VCVCVPVCACVCVPVHACPTRHQVGVRWRMGARAYMQAHTHFLVSRMCNIEAIVQNNCRLHILTILEGIHDL